MHATPLGHHSGTRKRRQVHDLNTTGTTFDSPKVTFSTPRPPHFATQHYVIQQETNLKTPHSILHCDISTHVSCLETLASSCKTLLPSSATANRPPSGVSGPSSTVPSSRKFGPSSPNGSSSAALSSASSASAGLRSPPARDHTEGGTKASCPQLFPRPCPANATPSRHPRHARPSHPGPIT